MQASEMILMNTFNFEDSSSFCKTTSLFYFSQWDVFIFSYFPTTALAIMFPIITAL